MTKIVEYIGPADARVISEEDMADSGFIEGGPLVWNKANGYELPVEDSIALWLVGQNETDFKVRDFDDFVDMLDDVFLAALERLTLSTLIPAASVPTEADLPTSGNLDGHFRSVDDTGEGFAWYEDEWVNLGRWRGLDGESFDPEDIDLAVEDAMEAFATLDDGLSTKVRAADGIGHIDSAVRYHKPLLSVSNTSAETNWFETAARPKLPAGLLANGNGLLRGSAFLVVTNNSGSNQTLTAKLKLNGSTMITWVSGNIPSQAGGRHVRIDFELTQVDPIGLGWSPSGLGKMSIGAGASGVFDLGSVTTNVNPTPALPSAEMLDELNFNFSVKLSAAHADLSILGGWILLEPMAVIR